MAEKAGLMVEMMAWSAAVDLAEMKAGLMVVGWDKMMVCKMV